jgi:hypothetical protein
MTAYSDIRGYRVKYLASDPTLNTSTEGQVWYNSTEGVLKSLVQIKAWSCWWEYTSTARRFLAGAGTQTAGLAFGGYTTSCFNSNRRIFRIHLVKWWKFRNCKIDISRNRYTNSWFSIWWIAYNSSIQINRRIRWLRLDSRWKFGTSRSELAAAAGLQTAGLKFGGNNLLEIQMLLKNMMELLGQQEEI